MLGRKIEIDTFYKGNGCNECNGSGYKGRVGIYEIMEVSPNIKGLISKQVPAIQIEEAAIKEGMTRLFEDGINKAAAGQTTIEEALRVMQE
jgi:type II secretory ATPase GspE/PulE/Tfp pilus assembly ATPase PilB-like protein